jgi:DNA-directed RNA polymerase specialized sigma subunit
MADIDAYKKQLLDVDSSVTNQYTMVKRVAYHLRSRLPSNISTDDLVQAGMEGLLQAKAAFDQSRGINFELFAKTRIRGAMLDEVRPNLFLYPLNRLNQTRARESHQRTYTDPRTSTKGSGNRRQAR